MLPLLWYNCVTSSPPQTGWLIGWMTVCSPSTQLSYWGEQVGVWMCVPVWWVCSCVVGALLDVVLERAGERRERRQREGRGKGGGNNMTENLALPCGTAVQQWCGLAVCFGRRVHFNVVSTLSLLPTAATPTTTPTTCCRRVGGRGSSAQDWHSAGDTHRHLTAHAGSSTGWRLLILLCFVVLCLVWMGNVYKVAGWQAGWLSKV